MRLIWCVFALIAAALATEPPSFRPPMIQFDRVADVVEMSAKYSSVPEMIDVMVDDVCEQYPEIHPGETILLKRDLWMLMSASTSPEKAKQMSGRLSKFKYASAAWEKLKEIGKQDEPWNEHEERMKDMNEEQYILFKLCLYKLIKFLDHKKDKYELMTDEEIKEDMKSSAANLVDKFFEDAPNKAGGVSFAYEGLRIQLDKPSYLPPMIQFDRWADVLEMVSKYTSMSEMIDAMVDAICQQYPEVRPGGDGDPIFLKREFFIFMTEATDEEKEELKAGRPSKFKYVSEAWKKLKEIGKKEEPMNYDEQKLKDRNEDEYIRFKLGLHHLIKFLDQKKDYYESQLMTQEEITKEMMSIADNLVDKFYEEAGPRIQFDRLDDVIEMMQIYSSNIEMADAVLDAVFKEYPELHPGDEQKMNQLQREIIYYNRASPSEQAEFLAGFPSEFHNLAIAYKKAKEIGVRYLPLDAEEQDFYDQRDNQFILYKLGLHHLLDHLDAKKRMYEEQGMTMEEIKKDVGRIAIELLEKIHEDDPGKTNVEASKEQIRIHYEL